MVFYKQMSLFCYSVARSPESENSWTGAFLVHLLVLCEHIFHTQSVLCWQWFYKSKNFLTFLFKDIQPRLLSGFNGREKKQTQNTGRIWYYLFQHLYKLQFVNFVFPVWADCIFPFWFHFDQASNYQPMPSSPICFPLLVEATYIFFEGVGLSIPTFCQVTFVWVIIFIFSCSCSWWQHDAWMTGFCWLNP